MKKTVKYKTHPIYKALAWLMLTVTVAALLFAWAVYASAGAKERRYDSALRACEYEAYLSFCEKLGVIADTDDAEATEYASVAAAEALSRYILFSELDADADVLRELLMSGAVGKERAAELLSAVSVAKTRADAVISVIKIAEGWGETASHSSARNAGGWEWLSSLPEVKERDAAKTAERFIGGGGRVRGAESHTFPLVYAYVNGNASAEVTRMGGRLIRMYKFLLGTAEKRTETECVLSAERFVRDAGIKDAELLSCDVREETAECVFASETGAQIIVRVSYSGAAVIYFDAYEYYKNR